MGIKNQQNKNQTHLTLDSNESSDEEFANKNLLDFNQNEKDEENKQEMTKAEIVSAVDAQI